MAWNVKNNWFLLHEVIFLERFGKVNFGTDSFCLNLFNFKLSILFTVPHCDQLLQGSFGVGNFEIFISFRSERVFYV